MESLGDILKKTAIQAPGSSTAPDGAAEPAEATAPGCPLCGGVGWVRADVPLSHPEFGKAIPCACSLKMLQTDRLSRLQKYSNLGPLLRMTFASLIPGGRSDDPENQQHFRAALEAARAFAQSPDGWLVFTGPPGCGKSHLAAAVANACLEAGRPAFFIAAPDLLDHLRATYSPGSEMSYDQLFEQVRTAPLLVLDDLGGQATTPWAGEKLRQIVGYRYNARLPTVVTVEGALDDVDERLRARLTDPSLARVFILERVRPPALRSLDILPLLKDRTFDTFDPRGTGLTGREQESLERAFRTARVYAEKPEGWLVFTGGHGCGKTHLAAAIANFRSRLGEATPIIPVPDLLDHLRRTFDPSSRINYDDLFDQVRSMPLLVLDDFGEHASTAWAQEKLYQIINYRYNARLPTVVTTSSKPEELESRIASRMLDMRVSNLVPIDAPDYRSGGRSDTSSDAPRKQGPPPR
ncbi:MAG: ATP-binding protein, partial [Chloroflexota bacterium]